jgi:type II secretory pathway pseudopilin PulG
MRVCKIRRTRTGFTLLEVMIAIVVLMVGVLGLAAMLADGMAYMNMAQADYIAQEKATEAIESIFTSRDMGQTTWNTICNVGSSVCSGGIFLAGAEPLCDPGPDGVIGTADDFNGATCNIATDGLILPGTTGAVNSTSTNRAALSSFKRTITITSVASVANLRQITVTITYTSGRFTNRSYTITTNISNFS